MSRWQRRPRPPADVFASLHLQPNERPLAWALDRDGRWHVGSDRALHLASQQGYFRLAWEQVERAEWQRDTERLAIVEAADWGEPERRHELPLDDPGQLLELLRERVTKSVLITSTARVRPRADITVVARRSPVGDGPVVLSYVLAEGLEPDDPQVAAVAEELRSQIGRELQGL